MEISIAIPVDASGFLRRECPTCEKEFKWFHGELKGKPSDFLDPESYFCPYCGVPSAVDSWWTPAQLEYVRASAAGPTSRAIEAEVERAFGHGVKYVAADNPVPDSLVDPDDMVMVEPPCHPFEPLKVADGWVGPIHCLVCGQPFVVD